MICNHLADRCDVCVMSSPELYGSLQGFADWNRTWQSKLMSLCLSLCFWRCMFHLDQRTLFRGAFLDPQGTINKISKNKNGQRETGLNQISLRLTWGDGVKWCLSPVARSSRWWWGRGGCHLPNSERWCQIFWKILPRGRISVSEREQSRAAASTQIYSTFIRTSDLKNGSFKMKSFLNSTL